MTQNMEMPTDAQKKAAQAYEVRKREKGDLKFVSFRLSPELIDKFDEKAAQAGLTRTELLKRWIDA